MLCRKELSNMCGGSTSGFRWIARRMRHNAKPIMKAASANAVYSAPWFLRKNRRRASNQYDGLRLILAVTAPPWCLMLAVIPVAAPSKCITRLCGTNQVCHPCSFCVETKIDIIEEVIQSLIERTDRLNHLLPDDHARTGYPINDTHVLRYRHAIGPSSYQARKHPKAETPV